MDMGKEMDRVADKRLKELTVLLADMSRLHQKLLEAVRHKLEAIRGADAEAMHRAARQEGELARRIKDQEGLRQLLMEELGEELGLASAQVRKLTVSELAARVAEPVRSRLTVLGAELRKCATEIARLNRVNAVVSQEMLKHFRTVYDTVTRGTVTRDFYGRTGRPQRGTPLALIDTTG